MARGFKSAAMSLKKAINKQSSTTDEPYDAAVPEQAEGGSGSWMPDGGSGNWKSRFMSSWSRKAPNVEPEHKSGIDTHTQNLFGNMQPVPCI